jgi:hypothetical protein
MLCRFLQKDIQSRVRCHCVHQIITFIRFHVHLYAGQSDFETVRDFYHRKALGATLDLLLEQCWRLLQIANRRQLKLSELISLTQLEAHVEEVIYNFRLGNAQFSRVASADEHFCMSLPPLYEAGSLDDTMVRTKSAVDEEKIGFVPSYTEQKDLFRSPSLARRWSIADFSV